MLIPFLVPNLVPVLVPDLCPILVPDVISAGPGPTCDIELPIALRDVDIRGKVDGRTDIVAAVILPGTEEVHVEVLGGGREGGYDVPAPAVKLWVLGECHQLLRAVSRAHAVPVECQGHGLWEGTGEGSICSLWY